MGSKRMSSSKSSRTERGSNVAKIGLQLYSVRETAEKDFLGTVRKVAKMGYHGVQFAGFFNTPAKELKQVMDETGIIAAGSHMGYETLQKEKLGATLNYNYEIGNDLIICPGLPGEFHEHADGYKRAAEFFNEVGEACRGEGFTFGYHNHGFDFDKINGQTKFDILFGNTDPSLVKIELDCYWATHAGIDPWKIIEKYQERCVSLHIKDMKRVGDQKVSTEIGGGELDIAGLLKVGEQCGTRWFTVEQEDFERDPMESAEINVRNLKQIVKV